MHITCTDFRDDHLGNLSHFAREFILNLRALSLRHRRLARQREAATRRIDRLDLPFDDRQHLCQYLELLTFVEILLTEGRFRAMVASGVGSAGVAIVVVSRIPGPVDPLAVALSAAWLAMVCLPWARQAAFRLLDIPALASGMKEHQQEAVDLGQKRLSNGRTIGDELVLLVPELPLVAQQCCLKASFEP